MCLRIVLTYSPPLPSLPPSLPPPPPPSDASSPDMNIFGVKNKSKPENLAICQPAHIKANMSAHPKAAGLLAITEGMTSFLRKEMEEAKAGFSRREGEEECAWRCG